jgi:HK97 family phage portal protein
MSLLNFIKDLPTVYSKYKSLTARQKEDFFFASNNVTDSQNFKNSRDYLNAYQLIGYVGFGASVVASDIASLKYRLVDSTGNVVEDIKIMEMLGQPNQVMSWYEFVYTSMIHLLLEGNSFLVPEQTNMFSLVNNDINELRLMNPSTVTIRGPHGQEIKSTTVYNGLRFSGYEIQDDYTRFTLFPEDMLQAKYSSPHNFIRGMGVAQKGASALDADRLQSLFTSAFFLRGAKPDFVMQANQEIGPKEWRVYKRQFEDEYTGVGNLKRIPFVPQGWEMKQFEIKHDDMQFIEQKQMTKEDVFGIMFGIPPIRIPWRDAKYDSAEEQERVYYQTVIPGHYKPFQEMITRCIQQKTKKPLFFEFINKDVSDIEKVARIMDTAFNSGYITGSEARKSLPGVDEVNNDHLNTYYMPMNKMPANMLSEPQDNSKCFHIKAPRASRRAMRIHNMAKRLKNTELKRIVEKNVSDYYKGLTRRIETTLEKSYNIPDKKLLNLDELIVFESETVKFLLSAERMYRQGMKETVLTLNETLGSEVKINNNPAFEMKISKMSKEFVDQQLNTRRKELESIIRESIDDGVGVSEITARMKDAFSPYVEGWKLDRIARTESSFMYDQAAKESYKELGVSQVQVVGCMDAHEGYDCDTDGSRGTYPIERMDSLNFHPNHTGTIVPVLED